MRKAVAAGLTIVLVVVGLLTSYILGVFNTESKSPRIPFGDSKLALSNPPALGQTTTLTFTIDPVTSLFRIPQSGVIRIVLENGLEWVDDNSIMENWNQVENVHLLENFSPKINGAIRGVDVTFVENVPIRIEGTIKAVKTGTWNIEASIASGPATLDYTAIHVQVSENSAQISDGYWWPLMENENFSPTYSAAPRPSSGIQLYSPVGLVIDNTVELKYKVWSMYEKMENATIQISLPDGFVIVNGVLARQENIPAGADVEFTAYVKMVKLGDWEISACLKSADLEVVGGDKLYVTADENSVSVSHVHQVPNILPAVELDESQIPPEYRYKKETETHSVTVEGILLYPDINGDKPPVIGAKVEVYDIEYWLGIRHLEKLGETTTNGSGYFKFITSNEDSGWFDDGNGPDIVVHFLAEDSIVNVRTPGPLGGTYTATTGDYPDSQDCVISETWEVPTDPDHQEAWRIFAYVNEAWNFLNNDPINYQMEHIDVNYPTEKSQYHVSDWQGRWIDVAPQYQNPQLIPDVVGHEYGHFVMNEVYNWGYPPGPFPEHDMNEAANQSAAWAEGWASFFALAVKPDDEWTNYNIETPQGYWESTDIVEGRVVGALYDLFDSSDDGLDHISLGFKPIWDVFVQGADPGRQQDTFRNFWLYFYAKYFDDGERLHFSKAALFQNTIDYDNPPTCTITPITGWQTAPVTLSATAGDINWEDYNYLSVIFGYSRNISDMTTIDTDSTPPYSVVWAPDFQDDSVWVRAVAYDGMKCSPPSITMFSVRPLNTSTGGNVTIMAIDPQLGVPTNVTVTFSQVLSSGDTTAAMVVETPPDGYMLLGNTYDVNTTATYSGPVTIEIRYSDAGLTSQQESVLQLFHQVNGQWVNITTAVDTANNVIRGQTSSLSVFGVMLDVAPPASAVNPVSHHWQSETPFTVTAQASDDTSGVEEVMLFYRHSSDNASWRKWRLFGTDNEEPWGWEFNAPEGDGYYEFCSVATDAAGNVEGAQAGSVATDDLVSWWDFEGNVMDRWGNNDGTIYGASFVPGMVGQALSFDGVDDYVDVGNDPSIQLTNNFTVELWVKRDSYQSSGIINGMINKFHTWPGTWMYEGWSIISSNDGRLGALLGNGSSGSNKFLYIWTQNTYSLDWHHVALVANANIWTMYVDGEFAPCSYQPYEGSEETTPIPYVIYESGLPAHIGDSYAQADGGSPGYFDGQLDGIRIYNRALSAEEVIQNYQATPAVLNLTADADARVDTTQPVSYVHTVSPYWQGVPQFTVTAQASDSMSGVERVALWYRYSSNNRTWGSWTEFGTDNDAPWSWSFNASEGDGYYEFYSVAVDVAGNTETAPTNADAACEVDTVKPESTAREISRYWWDEPTIMVTAQASDDRSGVASVALWYRYSPDNATWGDWKEYNTDSKWPWQWFFEAPDGDGYYEFYTIGVDQSRNVEDAPEIADACVGIDRAPPESSVNLIVLSGHDPQSFIITAQASDNLSGVDGVMLFYKHSYDNSTWGDWKLHGIDHDEPWDWEFTPEDNGYYQFGTLAVDRAGNLQPGAAESRETLEGEFRGFHWWEPNGDRDWGWSEIEGDYMNGIHEDGAGELIVTTYVENMDVYLDSFVVLSEPEIYQDYGGVSFDDVTLQSLGPVHEWNVVVDNVKGTAEVESWDSWREGEYEFGYGATYSCTVEANVRIIWPEATASVCGDITPPNSSIAPITPYWRNDNLVPFEVSATASDVMTGVENVELLYRHSPDNLSWSEWRPYGIRYGESPSWDFTAPDGDGYYEFCSVATDRAGNSEPLPGAVITAFKEDFDGETWNSLARQGWDSADGASPSVVDGVLLVPHDSYPSKMLNVTPPFTVETKIKSDSWAALYIAGIDELEVRPPADGVWHTVTIIATTPVDGIFEVHGYVDNELQYVEADLDASWAKLTYITLYGPPSSGNAWFDNIAVYTQPKFTTVARCAVDTMPPVSSVNSISPYWQNASGLNTTALDGLGVENVELWYRYSGDNVRWSDWKLESAKYNAGPSEEGLYKVSVTIVNPTGEDYAVYQELSVQPTGKPAVYLGSFEVPAGENRTVESDPVFSSSDEIYIFLEDTVNVSSEKITFDGKNVEAIITLNYADGVWGAEFTALGPWSWSFTAPEGDGFYEFYSVATDWAGNREDAPSKADAVCGVDATLPASSVDQVTPYWHNASMAPFAASAAASDATSGVKGVELYYTYSTDNSTWGPWASYGADNAAPWSWSFTAPNGDGYYKFRSVATDIAGNREIATSWDWLGGWQYRRQVNISGGVEQLSDCQVRVEVPWSSGMLQDYGDIRFTSSDGTTLLPYWIEISDSTSAKVWVKVPSIPAGGATVYVYYGNPDATSASSGDDTFVFFDDFSGSSWADKWTLRNGTAPTEANGLISLVGSTSKSTAPWLSSKFAVPLDTVTCARFYAKPNIWATQQVFVTDSMMWYPDGSCYYSTDYNLNVVGYGMTYWVTTNFYTASASAPGQYVETARGTYTEGWKDVEMAWTGGSVAFKSPEGSWAYTQDVPAQGSVLNIQLTGGRTVSAQYDIVYVRKFAQLEPTTSVGTEQVCAGSGPADVRAGVDTIPPVTSHELSGTDGNNGWWTSDVGVALTATDNLSGASRTLYCVDDGAWQTYVNPFSVSDDGVHLLEYYSVDIAGNEEATKSIEIKVDATPPVSSVDLISPYWKNADMVPFDVNATASDSLSGVAGVELWYRYSADNSTWGEWTSYSTEGTSPYAWSFNAPQGEGYYEFCSSATDAAGNAEAKCSAQTCVGYIETDWEYGEADPSDALNGGWSDGNFYLERAYGMTVAVRSYAQVEGNFDFTNVQRIGFDVSISGSSTGILRVLVGDSVVWSGRGPGNYSSQTVDVSGFAGTQTLKIGLFFDGGSTSKTTYKSVALNNLWYERTIVQDTTESACGVDTAPPTTSHGLSGSECKDGWWRGDVDVALTATDDLSGVGQTLYRVDGGTWQTCTNPFVISNGVHSVDYYSMDIAGNEEETKSFEVKVDALPPTTSSELSGTAGGVGWWRSDVSVALSATDNLSGVDQTLYRVDNGAWDTYSNPFAVGDGVHSVEYYSVDVAGNEEAVKSIEIRVDLTPPVSSVDQTEHYWQVQVPFTVTATASDNLGGVAGVGLYYRYSSNGSSWGPWALFGSDTEAPWSWSFTTRGDGYYELYTVAADEAGNVEAAPELADLSLGVDTAAPATTHSLSGASGNAGWWLSNVTVSLSAADAASGVSGTAYRVDNGDWQAYAAPFAVSEYFTLR